MLCEGYSRWLRGGRKAKYIRWFLHACFLGKGESPAADSPALSVSLLGRQQAAQGSPPRQRLLANGHCYQVNLQGQGSQSDCQGFCVRFEIRKRMGRFL